MGQSMASTAHQPGPVRVEGGVIRWLAGVVGFGAELHQRHPHAARGALLQFDWLRKTWRPGALPAELLRKAWPGWLGYAACSREGQGEKSSRCLPQPRPCQMGKKKAVVVHVTRWQSQGHRCWHSHATLSARSLVSKGRFAISISPKGRSYE
jgi:hypothetical protein